MELFYLQKVLDAATEGARRAALPTQRLLAFSRQQPLNPQTTDINKVVSGMSDLLRQSLGTDIRLETVLAGGLWRTNRLTIETQNAHLDHRYVSGEPGIAPGQYVLLAVTDTGIDPHQAVWGANLLGAIRDDS